MKKDLGLPEQPAVPRVVTAEPLAHVAEDSRAHLLREHLEAVGQWAAMLAPREDLRAPALATGRWHDLGKYTRDFQIRIRKENGFEAHLEKEGALERDHSTAGALWALSRDPRLLPLALAIAGHHAGLPDLAAFKARLGREGKQALLADARLAVMSQPCWTAHSASSRARCCGSSRSGWSFGRGCSSRSYATRTSWTRKPSSMRAGARSARYR
ncbi:CRISPR-associated endonuclease Cas3'' [Myxococcus sp. MxC21-1]|uniref:CRISPR-associated endonuclease Cas3'' n=1 Tax=Myxococcus sp. MxC21-1 TaxID=3041439 RepID=UPI0029310340|nr:CRISPR-associated endonuclease Cas3'' [Myxococcus sp. MxC21-1]WNZ61825.1 CRISPR-associated endonuclease Cas3'' [Myxococcus sp. MxC21-1]